MWHLVLVLGSRTDMVTTAIHFQLRSRADRARTFGRVEDYVSALWRNGQILGPMTPMARTPGGYLAIASLPALDSLDPSHSNAQVRRALRALAEAGYRAPRVQRLGLDPDDRPACRCRRRPYLILFTSFLHSDSPVRCGEYFDPVPLYVFPTTGEAGDYHDILWWQDTYQAIDRLWIGSGAGERFGHDQMARHDSPLSREGRGVASELERRARRPVYYYLARAIARSHRRERARRCPSCRGAWLLEQCLHKMFDFKCDRCRLLSNIAWDVRR